MSLVGQEGRDDVVNGRHLAVEGVLVGEAQWVGGRGGGARLQGQLDGAVYEPNKQNQRKFPGTSSITDFSSLTDCASSSEKLQLLSFQRVHRATGRWT